MKPGDLVSIKGRYGASLGNRAYLVLVTNDQYAHLEGFPSRQVFKKDSLEVMNEAR